MMKSKRKRMIRMLVLTLVTVGMLSVSVYAKDEKAVSTDQAMQQLQMGVYNELSNNYYELEGGGKVKGADLFTEQQVGNLTVKGYDLDEDAFNDLSSKAQNQVVGDIAEESKNLVGSNGITNATVSDWWKTLQSKKGVGSKFISQVLGDTSPNFVKAWEIFRPFSNPLNVVLGLISIIIMSGIGLVMACDISYIVLPPVRIFVDNKKDSGSKNRSLIFSYDAMHAVEIAENGSNGDGENKQALAIYFKRRAIALVVLGICLLYLVNGRIYVFVGYILDLVSGFF